MPTRRISKKRCSDRSLTSANDLEHATDLLQHELFLLTFQRPLNVSQQREANVDMTSTGDEFQYQLSHIHDSRQGAFLAINIACVVAATVVVALRLLARKLVKVDWSYDDYTIVVALVMRPLLSCRAIR